MTIALSGKTLVMTTLVLALTSCSKKETGVSSTVSPPVQAEAKPAFIPPTAEEAYRLQDDCTRRGEKILRANVVGSALTQDQTSRYSARTNRCYVRLSVHAKDLSQWGQHENSTYLEDGQTGEMLAFFTINANGAKILLGIQLRRQFPG